MYAAELITATHKLHFRASALKKRGSRILIQDSIGCAKTARKSLAICAVADDMVTEARTGFD